MSREEIKKLFIAGAIFAGVLACLIARDIITTAQAIEPTILFVLVLVTAMYVKRTAEMAKEMKEQRLSEAQPYLLLRLGLADDEFLQWDTYQGKPAPREFKVTMRNEGKGPAINLWAALWHRRKTHFFGESKGYLAPGEEWQTNISRLNTMIEEEEGWLPKLGEHIRYDDPGVVAVKYQDIHKRTWVSYLCLERHVDIEEFVMEGEQNIVEYQNDS